MKYVLLFFIVLFFFCCSKEDGGKVEEGAAKKEFCYELSEIEYSFKVPDTVFFDQQVVIDGKVNKPVTMKFVIDSLLIGEISQEGQCIWIPTKNSVTKGEKSFTTQVVYCSKDGHSEAVASVKKMMVLEN